MQYHFLLKDKNKMKRNIKAICLALLALAGMSSCSDWTDTEIKDPTDLTTTNRDAAYYQRLKAYKASDHAVAFGWFGNWTGNGAKLENCLMGLPDSVDFVSIWGNFKNISQDQKDDLRQVQQLKGTKALICFIVMDIGDQITPEMPQSEVDKGTTWDEWRHQFWGWGSDEASQLAATEKYANAICDTIEKYGYDGFDLDAEPDYAQPFNTNKELWRNDAVMDHFVETISKRIGPASGTDKMLVVDGQPERIPAKYADRFNYFILQAYASSSDRSLDSRVAMQYDHYKDVLSAEQLAKKIIVCENFESYASKGGVSYTLNDGTTVPSLLGMAYWNPTIDGKQYRKGGVGSYHMEYEYSLAGIVNTYPYLRKAISIMNPVIK